MKPRPGGVSSATTFETGLLLAEEFPKFEVLIVLDFHIDHGGN